MKGKSGPKTVLQKCRKLCLGEKKIKINRRLKILYEFFFLTIYVQKHMGKRKPDQKLRV